MCYTIYTHDSEKPLVGSYLVGAYIFNPRLFSITIRVVVRYQYTRTLSRLLFVTNYLLHIYSRYNYLHIFDSRKILI